MQKSDLINHIAKANDKISVKKIDLAVKEMIEHISITLEQKNRVEIRGFGSFSLHYRQARIGRNPKTGKQLKIASKYVPFFKPSKELKEKVNGQ